MAKFSYKAKDSRGQAKEGVLEASSEAEVIQKLSADGIYPISIEETGIGGGSKIPIFVKKGASLKDLYIFSSQLSHLLQGGLNLLKALEVLARQTANPKLKTITYDLIKRINDGEKFSETLQAHASVFDSFYISMVRSGEAGGKLDTVLERIAVQLEKEYDLRTKVSQALVYPGIITVVGIITVMIVMTFVIPKMSVMYEELDQSLPFLTQLLISCSYFVSHFWFLLFGLLFAAVYLIRAFFKKGETDVKTGSAIFKLPLWGEIFLKEELVRFSKTLGMLLGGGVSILESLRIVQGVVRNGVFRDAILKARDAVQQGTSLATFIESLQVFPMAVVQLLHVGEETGSMDLALERIGGIYEKELDQEIKMLMNLLEPILILIIGSVIGLMAIGMFLPIFEISILG